MLSPIEQRISAMISPAMEGMGYALVRVKASGDERSNTLQIMAEKADGNNLSLDDCQALNGIISRVLDVEDPIKEAYRLEISSPGIDRPLVRPRDFTRYTGQVVKLELHSPLTYGAGEGRKRFRGVIVACDEATNMLQLQQEGIAEVVEMPLAMLDTAKLVLTDALIAFSKAQAAQQNSQQPTEV